MELGAGLVSHVWDCSPLNLWLSSVSCESVTCLLHLEPSLLAEFIPSQCDLSSIVKQDSGCKGLFGSLSDFDVLKGHPDRGHNVCHRAAQVGL